MNGQSPGEQIHADNDYPAIIEGANTVRKNEVE
jgi:hypothetical protein